MMSPAPGMAGEQYEVRYNHVIGHGDAIGGLHFDIHQDEETGTAQQEQNS